MEVYRGYSIRTTEFCVRVHDPFGFWVFDTEIVDDAKAYIDSMIEEEWL